MEDSGICSAITFSFFLHITIEKVEKGSGNQLYDRSVLRAITMASPLPPPLKEMEIGLRFRP